MRVIPLLGKFIFGVLVAALALLTLVTVLIVLLNSANGNSTPRGYFFMLMLLAFAFALFLVYRGKGRRPVRRHNALLGVLGGAFLVFVGAWKFLNPEQFASCNDIWCTIFQYLPEYSFEILVALPIIFYGIASIRRSIRRYRSENP